MPLPDDTPLRGLPCAVLDVEATGFGEDSHIIEIAVAHVTLGQDAYPRVAFHSRVRPPVPVPALITELTGITTADLLGAPTWASIANEVLGACEGRVVAAYNAPADYLWCKAEFLRAGRVPLAWPWLDLLVLRRATVAKGPPGRLSQIVEAAGIDLEPHGAAGDAVATALVLHRLMLASFSASNRFTDERGARARWDYDHRDNDEPAAPVTTLGPFLGWQRRAAFYQERDYARYRQKEGDRTAPRSPWHEIEGVPAVTWTKAPPPTRNHACGRASILHIGRDGAVTVREPSGEPHVCPASARV